MATTSTPLEFVMSLVEPNLTDEPAIIEPLGPHLWQVQRQMEFPLGLSLPCRMTVMRAPKSGRLMLHSPIAVSEATWDEIEKLGEVAAIVAPNSFHHAFVSDCLERYPSAHVYAAPGLANRVSNFPESTELGPGPPANWEQILDLQLVGSDEPRYAEAVFFHKPSETLVLTDLAFVIPPESSSLEYFGWRLFGLAPSFGPSRNIRMTLFRYIDSLGDQLAPILGWDFERITIAHGPPVESNAKRTFREAFGDYLPARDSLPEN